MTHKKIVHIISSLHLGGAESYLYRLILSDDKYNHVVFALRGEDHYVSRLKAKGIIVFSMKFKKHPVRSFIKLYKEIKYINPDSVCSWLYYGDLFGSLVGMLLNYKPIWNVRHGEDSKVTFLSLLYMKLKFLALLSYIAPQKIIYNSRSSRNFHENFLGYKKNIGIIISNGVDCERFKPTYKLYKQRHGEEVIVGTVARYHYDKGYDILLKAIAILINNGHKIRLLVAGSDTDGDEMYSMLKKLRIKEYVEIYGVIENIEEFYPQLDIFILSSRTESCPNALLEAMACGIPSIATNVGDVGIILGENGIIVKKEDPEILAESIINMKKKPEESKKSMVKISRNLIETYFNRREAYSIHLDKLIS